MAGIPPMIGFAAKELGLKSGLAADESTLIITAALVVAGAATVGVAAIASLGPFSGPPARPRATVATTRPGPMWLGPLVARRRRRHGRSAAGPGLGSARGGRRARPSARASPSTPWSRGTASTWRWLLSLLSIAVGVVIFWRRLDVRELVGPRRHTAIASGRRRSTWCWSWRCSASPSGFTGFLQNGQLRLYLLIVVATLVALVWLILLCAGGLPTLELDGDIYPWEAIIAALIAGGAAVAVTSRSRLGAVTALGVVGYGIALVYVLFSAPDLAIAQILVETLTVLLFVLVFYHMPKFGADTARGSRLRDGAIAIAAGVLVTLFVLAATARVTDPVSTFFVENSQPLAKGQNVVNTIIVDFRCARHPRRGGRAGHRRLRRLRAAEAARPHASTRRVSA